MSVGEKGGEGSRGKARRSKLQRRQSQSQVSNLRCDWERCRQSAESRCSFLTSGRTLELPWDPGQTPRCFTGLVNPTSAMDLDSNITPITLVQGLMVLEDAPSQRMLCRGCGTASDCAEPRSSRGKRGSHLECSDSWKLAWHRGLCEKGPTWSGRSASPCSSAPG